MALTVNELFADIRGSADDAVAPTATQARILGRLQSVAAKMIALYAPDAPEDVRDQATVNIVAYLWSYDPAGSRNLYGNAFASSGAAGLLEMWRQLSVIIFGAVTPASGMASGGGATGPAVDQAAINAAIALHDMLEDAHRNLDFPAPTLAQVIAALEQASGGSRLDASHIKNIAAEIDTELGSNAWRQPNQPGQAGLTSSQVDDRIEAYTGQSGPNGAIGLVKLPLTTLDERWVRVFTALPDAYALGQLIALANADGLSFYRAVAFSTREVQYTIARSGDDTGYMAAIGDDAGYGAVQPPNQIWSYQWAYDSDEQALIARVESLTDPGASLSHTHGTLGTYSLRKTVGAGAGTSRNSFVDRDTRYQYELAASTDPFVLGGHIGDETFRVAPAGSITYWEPISVSGTGAAPAMPSGGLDQDAVDARIRAYTGQASAAALIATSRLPTASASGAGVISAALWTKVNALPPQIPGNANLLLGFDGSGNYETTGKDWLSRTDVDARVQAAKGTTAPGNTPGSPKAGTAALWSPQDHDHGISPGSGGGGLDATAVTRIANERTAAIIPTWTGQTAGMPRSRMSLGRMPSELELLARAYDSGGIRPYPGSLIQLGQIKNSAYTASQFAAIPTEEWSNTGTRPTGDGTAIEPNAYAALRISRTAFTPAPASLPMGYGLRASPDEPQVAAPALTRLAAADTATYWAYSVDYGSQPADDDLILEVIEAASLNVLPPDGSLGPSKLKGLGSAGIGRLVATAADDSFQTEAQAGFRQIYSGSTGISPTSLSATSGILTYAFDREIDLATAGDGLIIVDDHLRIVVGPAALSFSSTAVVKTINVRGQLSLQQLGFEGIYNGGAEIGAVIISTPLYMGSTQVGAVVRRISRTRLGTRIVAAGNIRYDRSTGHSNIAAASISDQSRHFFLATDAPLLPRGAIEHLLSLPEVLPMASAGFRDLDVAVVGGSAERGVWQHRVRTTSGPADTGWAGKTITIGPAGNLQPVDSLASDGLTYRHNRYAARAYTDPRGTAQIPAGGRSPGVAGLYYIDLSYVAQGQANARFDIVYDSARTDDGDIAAQTEGNIQYSVLIPNLTTTSWRSPTIDVGTLAHVLASVLTMTEPNHVNTVIEYAFELVANTVSQVLTQQEYDDLATKEDGVLYLIPESE